MNSVQTIEHLFYFAFLVKDGRVACEKSADGDLVICTRCRRGVDIAAFICQLT